MGLWLYACTMVTVLGSPSTTIVVITAIGDKSLLVGIAFGKSVMEMSSAQWIVNWMSWSGEYHTETNIQWKLHGNHILKFRKDLKKKDVKRVMFYCHAKFQVETHYEMWAMKKTNSALNSDTTGRHFSSVSTKCWFPYDILPSWSSYPLLPWNDISKYSYILWLEQVLGQVIV